MTWLTRRAEGFARAVKWLVGAVGDIFDNLLEDVGSEFDKLQPEIQDFVRDAVANAVASAQKAGGSPHDKLGAAVASVLADLTGRGVKLGLHVVYSLIMAAVSDMREKERLEAPLPPSDA